MAERIVIVGGGVGGLVTALALGRAGHEVTILERDAWPDSPDAEAAFNAERRGAPQVHQTHGFLARLQVVLRERFPDVLDALVAAGCWTMPTTTSLGDEEPGDDDLRVIIVRRTTLDWVLRRAVLREPNVTVRTGVTVTGLTAGSAEGAGAGAEHGIPTITGVTLAHDGVDETVTADAVVVASGRRDGLLPWLAAVGVEVPETVRESGLMYLSRWYEMPASHLDELDPKLGGDLGFVKYLGVPGDGETLSITLAIRPDDKELRTALSDADGFEHACRILPGPSQFFAKGDLEPIGGIRPMAGLMNRKRAFAGEDGTPVVLGLHAVGDAHTCTNPLYGRGCSLAAVQGTLLADAFAAHPGDALGRARAYEQASAREVLPWYDVSVEMDKAGADPAGFGGKGNGPDDAQPRMAPTNPLAAVFVAAASDPVIGRAFGRFFNLLQTPQQMMSDPVLLERIAAVMADPDAFPPPPREGPTRRELLAQLTERTPA